MKHIFITYGDSSYASALARIIKQAKNTGEFDEIYSYGRENLSEDLLRSEIITIKRGGGLWSWKPDVILSTMEKANNGDIIVYCDAGCSLYKSGEWKRYWKKLKQHDIIAQRIFQRTDQWTRKEILDMFDANGKNWTKCFQYQATPIFKVSDFSKQFVLEWRNLMIDNPILAMDVTKEERSLQHPNFIENRHDQAIFSALIYKYLASKDTNHKIYTQWEHIEDLDPFVKQAIRATRLRHGEEETVAHKCNSIFKRIIKDFLYKPFYYNPLNWWYRKNCC